MEIRGYFELEARELSERLSSGAGRLDGGAAPEGELRALARAAHTLKGAAHVVGESGVAALAHSFEDALASYRAAPSRAAADVLVELCDRIAAALMPAAVEDAPDPMPPATLQPASASSARVSQAPVPAPVLSPEPAPAAPVRTVRVALDDTARVLAHMDVASNLLSALRRTLAEPTRDGEDDLRGRLGAGLDRLERELGELHQVGLELRLLPVDGLLLEAGRTVRATAARLGRQVRITTTGGGERVSLELAEALGDALLHLLRNAVAHGIEPPDERVAEGKPAEGTIAVEVTRSGHGIRVRCTDDGRGIALAPLRAAAVRRSSLSARAAADAGSATLLPLLLEPGFSTADSTDQVSGRGVGLDAVRAAMERVGGTVAIATEPGRGSTFTLSAPQSVVAMAVLEVVAGSQRFALPAAAVEQTFLQAEHPIQPEQKTRTVRIGAHTMPYLALGRIFPQRTANPRQEVEGRGAGVVLRFEREGTQSRVALAVDRIAESAQRLVLPLPPVARVTAPCSGAAFDAHGHLLLVLDPSRLADAPQVVSPVASSTSAPQLPILVIDDSLTTRMLEQSILENEGYTVELAVSAEQGLEKARAGAYALFLVDVEMPGMNGFDFVRTAKADPALSGTPAILVTSLDSAEDRERGRAAGAASYIVKGEFNQQVYLDRIRALVGGTAARANSAASRANSGAMQAGTARGAR